MESNIFYGGKPLCEVIKESEIIRKDYEKKMKKEEFKQKVFSYIAMFLGLSSLIFGIYHIIKNSIFM